jgi:hypothetical protein
MNKKSNNELDTILKEKNKYTGEAIQAVIWELENRNIIEKDEIKHEETPLEKEVQTHKKSEDKDVENESPFEGLILPTLYSKKAIQGFTIFFSTLFGAILLMNNLKETNKPKARIQVLVFGLVYTISTVLLLNYLPKMFFITLIFNLIGYGVLVEYFWNKNLGKDLEYRKKPIIKPLIISLIILAAVIFLQFLPVILEA